MSAFGFVNSAQEPHQPGEEPFPVDPVGDAPSGSAFSFLGSPPVPGGADSAFGFLNSAASSGPLGGAEAPPGDSVFSFLNSSAGPSPSEEPGLSGLSFSPGPAVQASQPFGFMSQGSADFSAPDLGSPADLGSDLGPRRKTRKALLPGHAGRASEVGIVPPGGVPPPPSETWPGSTAHESPSAPEPPPEMPRKKSVDHTPPAWSPPGASAEAKLQPPPPPPPPVCEQQAQPPREEAPVRSSFAFVTSAPAREVQEEPLAPGFTPPVRTQPHVPQQPEAPVARPAPPPPPEPERKLTPAEKLVKVFNSAGLRQWLDEQAASSIEEQRALLEKQAATLSKSQQLADEVEGLRQRLARTEAEQNGLCDSERFEEAGALDSVIQDLKDAIAKQLEEVAASGRQMEGLVRDALDVARARQQLTEHALLKMEALQVEGTEAQEAATERSVRRLASESARLESERKRIGLAESHIEKDRKFLNEEWQQVTEAIDQETTDHKQERETAASSRDELDKEIEELKRTLERKLEQRRTLTEVIDSCDIRIASIRSKFEKQLTRLEGKQRRVEEAEKEIESDLSQVKQMAAELEKERQAISERNEHAQRQMAELQSEGRRLKKLRRFSASCVQMRVVWAKLLEPTQEIVEEARGNWDKATRARQQLAEKAASQEEEAARLRSQLDAAVQVLPSLEAAKKTAVAARSFKEAGRLTEEIKRREEEKRTAEVELENMQGGLAALGESLESCRRQEESAQAELLAAEEKVAIEELRVLRLQIQELEGVSKSPLLSRGDGRLVEQEIRLLKRQQEHLSKKYSVAPESLEEIPAEVLANFQEGGSSPSGADVSDVEEGFEEQSPQSPHEQLPSSPILQPTVPAETKDAPPPLANGDVTEAPPPAAAAEAPVDLEALRERHESLEKGLAALKVREQELDVEIEKACETEEYDQAEALEEERKQVLSQISSLEETLAKTTEQLRQHEASQAVVQSAVAPSAEEDEVAVPEREEEEEEEKAEAPPPEKIQPSVPETAEAEHEVAEAAEQEPPHE